LFEAEVAGTREIKYWVLGRGTEARAMARLYETGLMVNETMAEHEFGRSAPRQPKTGS
jgi:hypothetical protein